MAASVFPEPELCKNPKSHNCSFVPSSECLLRIAPVILSAKLMSKKIPEACDPADESREPDIQRSKASGL